ncbi:FtsK/SpoIIIE domain-containing protein [Streptomyces lydicus]
MRPVSSRPSRKRGQRLRHSSSRGLVNQPTTAEQRQPNHLTSQPAFPASNLLSQPVRSTGRPSTKVVSLEPGVVELRLVGFDVLRKVKMPRRTGSDLLTVPVALREDATAFVRDYRAVPHQLVLGATLSGKSMFLRNLLTGLAAQPVALVGIDCKRGVELAPFAPRLSALATDPDEAANLLPVLVKEMEDRYDLIKARQGIAPSTPDEVITSDVWGLPEGKRPHPIVVFVDEVAELFLVATRKDEERRDEMVIQLIRLAQLGRAAGIYLEICGQRFGAELGKGATMLRAQLTGRVCHRVNDEASAKMALGDIAPEAVGVASTIAAEVPGLAVAGDTSGGWIRIRTPYLSLADAAATCRETAELVPDVPALEPFRPHVPAQPVMLPVTLAKPRPAHG